MSCSKRLPAGTKALPKACSRSRRPSNAAPLRSFRLYPLRLQLALRRAAGHRRSSAHRSHVRFTRLGHVLLLLIRARVPTTRTSANKITSSVHRQARQHGHCYLSCWPVMANAGHKCLVVARAVTRVKADQPLSDGSGLHRPPSYCIPRTSSIALFANCNRSKSHLLDP